VSTVDLGAQVGQPVARAGADLGEAVVREIVGPARADVGVAVEPGATIDGELLERALAVVAPLTSQIRGLRGEVPLGKLRWLPKPSAVNVQGLASFDPSKLARRLGAQQHRAGVALLRQATHPAPTLEKAGFGAICLQRAPLRGQRFKTLESGLADLHRPENASKNSPWAAKTSGSTR
jgi:hypothetical protein